MGNNIYALLVWVQWFISSAENLLLVIFHIDMEFFCFIGIKENIINHI